MGRKQLFAVFFFAAFLFFLYQFYRVFHFFLGPLSWAAVLALVFHPVHRLLVRSLRQREGLAAFVLTTLIILVVIVPTIYFTVLLATESVALVQRVREALETGELVRFLERLRASAPVLLWERAAPYLDRVDFEIGPVLLKVSNAVSAFLVGQAPAAAANVLRFVGDFFLTTFALFFFFRDGERMLRGFRDLLPMERRHKDAILSRLYDTLSAVVQGTLATAVAQGALAGFGFWVLDVPFAVTLGCATALLSLLPMAGPLVWVGVAVYLVIDAEYARALLLTLWGTLIVASADNVLRPLIIGGRTQIPTIYLFFGILGGLQAYGFLGIFLGPALIAILVAFIRIYREQYAFEGRPQASTGAAEERAEPEQSGKGGLA